MKQPDGLKPLGDLLSSFSLPAAATAPRKTDKSALSPIKRRLLDGVARAVERPDEPQNIVFQHSVLCQTCLPYRDPGDDVRLWERRNGQVHLQINAGSALHPEEERFVDLGLPYGPKARMILMHINQRALAQQSNEIEIQDSLTKFVRRTLELDPNGRTMRTVKDQLARLAASSTRFGMAKDGHAVTINSQIISAFDLWFPKDDRQRVLWPSTIRLSLEYWESLKAHAVPLDEDHIGRLSHSALALDIYAWLANRLHRVPTSRPITLSWPALHAQFGQGYKRIDHFRAAFRVALREVMALYRTARIDLHEERSRPYPVSSGHAIALRESKAKGLTLHHSPPPVARS